MINDRQGTRCEEIIRCRSVGPDRIAAENIRQARCLRRRFDVLRIHFREFVHESQNLRQFAAEFCHVFLGKMESAELCDVPDVVCGEFRHLLQA